MEFYDGPMVTSGALANFLSSEANRLAGLSGSTLGTIVSAGASIFVAIIVGCAFGWKLALVCTSTIPLMLGCGYFRRNGSILYNFAITRNMRLLLAETSLVIRSLPELQNIPNIAKRFSSQRLETLVVSVANTTRDNISSMLADVRAGRQTEVEYINGYIVKRGEEIGIKCVVNYSTMQMVIGKSAVTQREVRGEYVVEPRDPNATA